MTMEGSNEGMRRKRRNIRLYTTIKKEEENLQICHDDNKKQTSMKKKGEHEIVYWDKERKCQRKFNMRRKGRRKSMKRICHDDGREQ